MQREVFLSFIYLTFLLLTYKARAVSWTDPCHSQLQPELSTHSQQPHLTSTTSEEHEIALEPHSHPIPCVYGSGERRQSDQAEVSVGSGKEGEQQSVAIGVLGEVDANIILQFPELGDKERQSGNMQSSEGVFDPYKVPSIFATREIMSEGQKMEYLAYFASM